MKAFIVGIMRFSVVTQDNILNWKETRGKTVEDVGSIIFAEDRLVSRFRLFESITLPCLDYQFRQAEDVFRFHIIASAGLPDHWKQRLDKISEIRPYMKIIYVGYDKNIRRVARQSIENSDDFAQDDIIFTFRLDDDDAVADFYTDEVIKLCVPENIGRPINFDYGIYLGWDVRREVLAYKEKRFISNAFGIGYISTKNHIKTIYDLGGHNQIKHDYDMISLPNKTAWIRAVHDINDSGVVLDDGNEKEKVIPIESEAQFKSDFFRFPFISFDACRDAMMLT